MTFPNVASGLAKVFKAQIFMLIGTVLLGISSAMMTVGALTGVITGGSALLIIGVILMIASLVLMVVGYINELIGVKRCGQDEEGYNTAFWCMIFSLIVVVLSVIFGLIWTSSLADDIAQIISRVLELLAILFIIQSTEVCLVGINAEETAKTGESVILFILLPYIIAIIVRIVCLFVVSPVVVIILAVISVICSVVGYILYLVFLKKSVNKLKIA